MKEKFYNEYYNGFIIMGEIPSRWLEIRTIDRILATDKTFKSLKSAQNYIDKKFKH